MPARLDTWAAPAAGIVCALATRLLLFPIRRLLVRRKVLDVRYMEMRAGQG